MISPTCQRFFSHPQEKTGWGMPTENQMTSSRVIRQPEHSPLCPRTAIVPPPRRRSSSQSLWSTYHSTVSCSPSWNEYSGNQPSSRSSFDGSMAYRRSWPGRSSTCRTRESGLSRHRRIPLTTSRLGMSCILPTLNCALAFPCAADAQRRPAPVRPEPVVCQYRIHWSFVLVHN